MKSNEFIRESDDKNIGQMLELIKRDCKPYLQQNSSALVNHPLWRGLNKENGAFKKKNVRLDNRIPRDTPLVIHDELNYVFQKKYKHPYRNGLFVTGAKGQTYDYGYTFIIFPIGNFEFLWNPDIKDLWDTIATQFDIDYRDTNISEETKNKLTFFLLQSNYQTTQLEKAIDSRGEIMIWTKSYYAINNSVFNDRWERGKYEKKLYK